MLDRSTPRELIDSLTPFGHIAIAPGKIDVAAVGDNLLTAGPLCWGVPGWEGRWGGLLPDGSGVPFWLGDEDGKGPLIESVSASSATFAQVINARAARRDRSRHPLLHSRYDDPPVPI